LADHGEGLGDRIMGALHLSHGTDAKQLLSKLGFESTTQEEEEAPEYYI